MSENRINIDILSKVLLSLQGPLAKYWQQDFNIFTAISDTYYRENLHSDLLALILNPRTDKIGNITYLKTFLEETKLSDFIHYFQDENSVEVCREAGDIDILIHNGQYCIIIENKINKAADMPNQLCRYLNWAEQVKNLEVLQIFYIPFEKDRHLQFNYDCGNKDYAFCRVCKNHQFSGDMKERLKNITKVLKIEELANILKKCALNADNIKYEADNYRIAKVFLEHYAKLILKVRGNMPKDNILKDMFNKIKHDNISNDEMKQIESIAGIWSTREATLRQILADKLFESYGYTNKLKFDRGDVYRKTIPGTNYSIDYYPVWGTFGLSFISRPDENAIKKAKKDLNEAIRNAKVSKEYFSQQNGAGYDGEDKGKFNERNVGGRNCFWVHLNFAFAKIKINNIDTDNPFDTIMSNAVRCFTELEKILKSGT